MERWKNIDFKDDEKVILDLENDSSNWSSPFSLLHSARVLPSKDSKGEEKEKSN